MSYTPCRQGEPLSSLLPPSLYGTPFADFVTSDSVYPPPSSDGRRSVIPPVALTGGPTVSGVVLNFEASDALVRILAFTDSNGTEQIMRGVSFSGEVIRGFLALEIGETLIARVTDDRSAAMLALPLDKRPYGQRPSSIVHTDIPVECSCNDVLHDGVSVAPPMALNVSCALGTYSVRTHELYLSKGTLVAPRQPSAREARALERSLLLPALRREPACRKCQQDLLVRRRRRRRPPNPHTITRTLPFSNTRGA